MPLSYECLQLSYITQENSNKTWLKFDLYFHMGVHIKFVTISRDFSALYSNDRFVSMGYVWTPKIELHEMALKISKSTSTVSSCSASPNPSIYTLWDCTADTKAIWVQIEKFVIWNLSGFERFTTFRSREHKLHFQHPVMKKHLRILCMLCIEMQRWANHLRLTSKEAHSLYKALSITWKLLYYLSNNLLWCWKKNFIRLFTISLQG